MENTAVRAISKSLRIEHISKSFGGGGHGRGGAAVDDLSLSVRAGSVMTLLGPSGCGKTTLLRMIAGLETPDSGEILLDENPITALPPEKRGSVMVFQGYALFPHMNVFDNVAYGLKVRGLKKDVIRERVTEMLKLVEMDGMGDNAVGSLSGGQQQRTALARALVTEPAVLLFDEPLSNLDLRLRVQMRTEIRRIQQTLGITAVYVTHDQAEAMAISDEIAVMKDGRLVQTGTPEEIYNVPRSEFVADFLGECSFLPAVVISNDNGIVTLDAGGCRVSAGGDADIRPGETRKIVIRPEAARLTDGGGIPGTVVLSRFMGAYRAYHIRIGEHLIKVNDYCPDETRARHAGDNVRIDILPAHTRVL